MGNENEVKSCSICGHIASEGTPESSDSRLTDRAPKLKEALVARLNRIEGQVRGIKGMVEKDIYCDDILNQIAAVQAAMKSVGKILLENHMRSCMVSRIQSGDIEVVDELLGTIEKLIK